MQNYLATVMKRSMEVVETLADPRIDLYASERQELMECMELLMRLVISAHAKNMLVAQEVISLVNLPAIEISPEEKPPAVILLQ